MTDTTPKTPFETWSARTVYQKILEVVEDYENGLISEEEVLQFLQELNLKDEEHFLDKIDEYNEELRFRLQKIDIANRALKVAGIVAAINSELEKTPGIDAQNKIAINKTLNEQLVSIKDLGDAKQVSEGISRVISRLEAKQRDMALQGSSKIQQNLSDMRDIAMGLKADYLGATRLGLGTGIVLGGPLGEILSLGFDKMQVEADNDGTKYISGFISVHRHELASALKSTANAVKNSPRLDHPL